MKRIVNVIGMMLAVNLALAAGGVGWMVASGHLTRSRMAGVRQVLFPPPATRPAAATTRPMDMPAPTDPTVRLAMLAARAAGRPGVDPTAAVQQVQDWSLADLDDRRRALLDLQQQVMLAQQQVDRDRQAVDRDRRQFAADRDRAAAAAADKGFQDSLAMVATLPPRQVKSLFATMPDDQVQRYLQAMDPAQATKVMKEFKLPADVQRLQRVLDRIRTAGPATQPSPPAATASLPTDGR